MAAAAAQNSLPDDYSLLKDLKFEIDKGDGAFTLCFWIYLSNFTKSPALIIRQIHADVEGSVPFLILNDKKMLLFPLLFLHEEAPLPGNPSSWSEIQCASTNIEYPFKKWIHVGCEVSSDSIHLHVNGVLVAEKLLSSSLKKESPPKDFKGIILSGIDGDNERMPYIHHAQILPQKFSIKDHFVKEPPIELSIDSSCISEIEEEGDGVWSIVGGKASCRRNFTLDVILLNALGHPVNKEMEVVASLLYADNGAPVEKPNDAEAPLLTSYDGIEFASTLRPSRLLHGRASFKLKISQLSSKCDNRLFRVRFDSPKAKRYPFLEAYSNPIRCISRSRTIRTSSLVLRRSTSATHILDGLHSLGVADGISEAQLINGDAHLPIASVRESKTSPPPKRSKMDQSLIRLQAAGQPFDGCNSHALNTNQVRLSQGENAFGASMEGKPENLEGTDNIPSDSESVQARESAFTKLSSDKIQVSDFNIFKYCLGGTDERALLLKEVATYASDQEMLNFAQQVSVYTGCSHHRYQIAIGKRLLQEGTDAWDLISQGNCQVLWDDAVIEIEEQFMKISRCSRGLMEQDLELLRRMAGCQEYITREKFVKMWRWLYPIAFALSIDWMQAIWGCTSPKWIEGLITKEEAESSLRSMRGIQEPGTFILRFPTSRTWPHPDAGSLICTYVDADYSLRHRILCLDYSSIEMNQNSLQDMILAEPELTRLARVIR